MVPLRGCPVASAGAATPICYAAGLMPETPRRGVLWDLDGTLIDSAEHHYTAWRDTLAELGREKLTRWLALQIERGYWARTFS